MPPVFAPGAWAGVNDAFAIARQKEQQDLLNASRRQQMQRDAWTMQTEQEDRQRQMRARGNAGRSLYSLAPPAAGGGQPQGPAPQPPMPGTPSAPMTPPGGGGQRMMAPGVPQFSAPPQGPAPMQGPGGPPGMRGAPTQPDPRAMEIHRCQTDIAALNRELAMPGQNEMQLSIKRSELAKAQDRLSQLTGQPPPYRSVPTGDAQPPQAQQPTPGPTAPPPVGGGQQAPHTSLLQQVIEGARKNGVPPEDLMDVVDTLSPVLKNQLQEELASLKGTQASQMMEIRALTLGLREQELARLAKKDERTGDQRDRALDQNAERIAAARKKAEAGSAPTASELQDPETARIFYDIYKVSGKTPPFAWGKAGEADRTAWMQAVKRFSKEDGQDGAGVAGGQADAKANAQALGKNTSALAAIRPFNAMLDKNANMAIDLARKVNLSDSTLANRPIQWLQANGGSNPDLREYLAQIRIVQTEAARVLNNPNLTGTLTDTARREMDEIIKGTMPLADTERVLKRLMADGQNRVKSIEDENAKLKRGASGKAGKADAGGASDDQDAQAIAWAKANPGDPRAKKIMALHPGS